MDIQYCINKIPAEKAKKSLSTLILKYSEPAFGTMSKRDFEILMFMQLQELGIISMQPDLYDIVTLLKITRTKARNLLYEANLRRSDIRNPDDQLRQLLLNPILIKDGDKIGIEIGDPFLIDHLKARLKKLKHITDASFSPELIRLSVDAYIDLFEYILPETSKESITKALVEIGAKEDTSIRGLIKGWLSRIGSKIADDAGSKVAEKLGEFLGALIEGSIDKIKKIISE